MKVLFFLPMALSQLCCMRMRSALLDPLRKRLELQGSERRGSKELARTPKRACFHYSRRPRLLLILSKAESSRMCSLLQVRCVSTQCPCFSFFKDFLFIYEWGEGQKEKEKQTPR